MLVVAQTFFVQYLVAGPAEVCFCHKDCVLMIEVVHVTLVLFCFCSQGEGTLGVLRQEACGHTYTPSMYSVDAH